MLSETNDAIWSELIWIECIQIQISINSQFHITFECFWTRQRWIWKRVFKISFTLMFILIRRRKEFLCMDLITCYMKKTMPKFEWFQNWLVNERTCFDIIHVSLQIKSIWKIVLDCQYHDLLTSFSVLHLRVVILDTYPNIEKILSFEKDTWLHFHLKFWQQFWNICKFVKKIKNWRIN